MTAHVTTPESMYDAIKRFLAMAVSPITAGMSSARSLLLFLCHLDTQWPGKRRSNAQDAISAGALAIKVPLTFHYFVKENLGWKELGNGVPLGYQTAGPRSAIYILPRTTRIVDDRYDGYAQPPVSNTLATVLAFLQLLYTVVQAYVQYGAAIRSYGLSSPYLVVFPYLYMSFINLLANLIQRTYVHITIVSHPRRLQLSHDNPSTTANTAINSPVPSTLALESASSLGQFHEWFATEFPGIEIVDTPVIRMSVLIHHVTVALVILFWIALLTSFRDSKSFGALFMTTITLDVALHPILNMLYQIYSDNARWKIVIVAVRIMCWSIQVWAFLTAGQILYEILLEKGGV